MTDREVMKLALEALDEGLTMKEWRELVAALRDRLAQPEMQPQTPDDLLRQSEREGWRYAKECEAEVKRLRQALEQPRQECETCANKRKRLEQSGFLKSPLRNEK